MHYRRLLQEEKGQKGIFSLEQEVSKTYSRSNDPHQYLVHLVASEKVFEALNHFYTAHRWRNWKFRLYSKKKKSEDKLCNRITKKYGERCRIYYGNWSRSTQMKGRAPTPNLRMKYILQRRFSVEVTDEFRTSRTCNSCLNLLRSYRKKPGRLSYSRLFCEYCNDSEDKKPVKGFVDRDLNAGKNIPLAGSSLVRPPALCRIEPSLDSK